MKAPKATGTRCKTEIPEFPAPPAQVLSIDKTVCTELVLSTADIERLLRKVLGPEVEGAEFNWYEYTSLKITRVEAVNMTVPL